MSTLAEIAESVSETNEPALCQCGHGYVGHGKHLSMERALTSREFHHQPDPCDGKLSNRCHRTGKTKIWKTRPGQYRIPVKFGMFGPSWYITNESTEYHAREDCPLVK